MTDRAELISRLEAQIGIGLASHYARQLMTKAADALEADAKLRAELFNAIKHGDLEHQDWLERAIADHFAGRTVERPRGKGSAERIAELKAENERLRTALTYYADHESDGGVIAQVLLTELGARAALNRKAR